MYKKLSKKELAKKLGYEYYGKGIDDKGEEGFCIRKWGTVETFSIGETQAQAWEWLIEKYSNLI